MKKSWILILELILVFSVLFSTGFVYSQSSVTRQITGSDSNMPEITLTVTPDVSTTSYYVIEFLIAEITPVYITGGGTIDRSIGGIVWGPFEDNSPRTFSYKMIGSTTACEIAGYAKFSSDPAAQTPKNYYKVYTCGDKIVNVIVPISHNITSLQPNVVYQVTTKHFAFYDSQPLAHPYYYPELHILNAMRDNIIGIRCYYGSEGTGFATFKKTSPYLSPIEWNIPEIEVISVTAQPISAPAGLQVTWQFKLSATNLWNVEKESICFGIFMLTDIGDYGVYCDLSNLSYSGGINKTFKSKRGIYVWKEGYNLVTQPVNQRNFFSFCAAPKGNAENKIESIIIALPSDINGTDNAAVKAFMAEAHSRGFKVHYVAGEPEWSFIDNRQTGADHINKIFTYNQGANKDQQFDSIQFDIEPHAIDTDNEPGMEPWVWEQFIQNIDYYQSLVNQNNSGMPNPIPFAVAIGNFWNEDYIPYDSYTGTGFEQVIDIVDKVAIMNYVTHYGAIFTCQDELEYCRFLNKPIDIVYETFNTSPTESFWFNGYKPLERLINTVEYAYVDPNSFSYYNKLEYNVIHYYEAENEVFPATGETKRSYRQLRPELSSPYEPLQPVYNTAPICYVTSPNGGETITTTSMTVKYDLYDDNSSVPIIVRIYLINTSANSQYLLVQQSVRVSATTHKYSGSYSARINSYPKTTGYRIFITVQENSGVTENNLSSFDKSNYDFTLKAKK